MTDFKEPLPSGEMTNNESYWKTCWDYFCERLNIYFEPTSYRVTGIGRTTVTLTKLKPHTDPKNPKVKWKYVPHSRELVLPLDVAHFLLKEN